ncbi:MAG: BatD family protein [Gemmatimonadota bacterium]|nr:BatD family protein [Gemmatimonadota bacterium]
MNRNRLIDGTRFLVAATLFGVFVPDATAQLRNPSARAYVDPPVVTVGEPVRLVVEVTGVRTIERVIPGRMPSAGSAGFAVAVRAGGSEEGVVANTFMLTYEFVPPNAGSFQVGAFQITADGRTMDTEPVAVRVNPRDGSEVAVRAWVTPARVRAGEDFDLSAEIVSSPSTQLRFIAPDVFDFAEQGSVSGSETSREWRLRAVVPGEFVIPPVRVTGPEGTYESEPLTVVIDPPVFEAQTTVEAGSIWVGGEFVVRLDVIGAAELDEEPVLPETGIFAEFVGLVDSSSLVGNVPPEMDRDYRFRALQAGRFEIGPVRVTVAGRTLVTDPIAIIVDEVPTPEEEPPSGLLLVGSAAKTRAYVNEPVVVTYAIAYDRMADAGWPSPGTASWPSFDGFGMLDLRAGGGPREFLVDGRAFEARGLRRLALLPLGPGRLSVDGAVAEARKPNRFGGWNRATGGPAMTSIVLASEPFTLDVLPLPDEGQPASFRGYVGTISVNSWVDRTRMAVGETMTLEVEVSVEGHVETLPDPEIEFPDGFAVSEPEVSTDFRDRRGVLSGSRTYVYRLTAVAPGRYRIPVVEMSYFDAGSESYGTARGQPFSVTVVAGGRDTR